MQTVVLRYNVPEGMSVEEFVEKVNAYVARLAKKCQTKENEISDFFAKKGHEELDALWESGEMNQEKLKSFETLHERTPYRR